MDPGDEPPFPAMSPTDVTELTEEAQDKQNGVKQQGVDALDDGKVDLALEKFTEAISIGCASSLLYSRRAQILLQLDRPRAAVNDCNAALEINPDVGKGYKIRGRAYKKLGMWSEAHSDLQTGLKLDFDEGTEEESRDVAEKAKDDEWLQSLDAFPEIMRPIDGPSAHKKRALQRNRLIGHICNCFRTVQRILKGPRLKLWVQFVSQDETLQCALPAQHEVLYDLLEVLNESEETTDKMASQLRRRARAAQVSEVDFADVLDVVETNHGTSRTSFLLGNSLGRLLLGNNESLPSSMEWAASQETARELFTRCRAEKSLGQVTATAAAYQRSLIVTASWQAERKLQGFLLSGNPSENWDLCDVLKCILRGIRAELAPVERLIWELLAKSSRQVDGSFARMDVLAMLSEMQQHVLEKEQSLGCFESDTAESELQELRKLRAECQQQAANEIFATVDGGQSVTLRDCLSWWRGITDDYREAMGLSVPSKVLQQQVQRQPEEMFRTLLWRAATEAEAAGIAVRGYSIVFCELRALDVRHAISASFRSLVSSVEQGTTTTIP